MRKISIKPAGVILVHTIMWEKKQNKMSLYKYVNFHARKKKI